jgi:hypothetical protein
VIELPPLSLAEWIVLTTTADGAVAARRWLTRPVAHVPDARSELLVNLALPDRRGREDGFGRVVASWLIETARAALRFLDDVQSEVARDVHGEASG